MSLPLEGGREEEELASEGVGGTELQDGERAGGIERVDGRSPSLELEIRALGCPKIP